MTEEFELTYDKKPFWAWDFFVLTACQERNYGNRPNWFFPFRSGLNGFHTRMRAAARNYYLPHAWVPYQRWPSDFEDNVATFFFNADSAIECLTFALNALGHAAFEAEFLSIADEVSLRKISPKILMCPRGSDGKTSPVGFSRVYPRTTHLWQSRGDLLRKIFEQHDVSKHRHSISVSGTGTRQAPEGFWEAVGNPDESDRNRYCPMTEIILDNDLKKPLEERAYQEPEEWEYLEGLAPDFFAFVSETGHAILRDSIENVPINVELQRMSRHE